ncbi:hypothetical protein cce_2553 [Crocosphaera subtropica ATCC 51142]|uniref:Uncharacterized protein n=1 Tax=Crocosphaera subtropica (strain ATCC 51142 / BH68) TaxID=43989 RepID=B1WSB5_CROS5|nr:DUF29 family protein [Crocosphaera subtropica]ACB51901.1 hypothetical protein cce_2553 [Crocosphaera subtropica ATCC 51142]
MTQELIELRQYINEGRYEQALEIIDDLEEMSKKAILEKIKTFLIRLLIHLIKNQVEQRLTNSWAVSIRDSLLKIQSLNLKDNNKSYYIKEEDWDDYLDEGLEDAIFAASVEVFEGQYNPFQLQEHLNAEQLKKIAYELLKMTYRYSKKTIRVEINHKLSQFPGGEDWIN